MSKGARPCIVWGATGHSKVAYDILRDEGVDLIHLFDNDPTISCPLPGIPLSYGPEGISTFIDSLRHQKINPSDIDCIAAIGGPHGDAREMMTLYMERYGFKPRSLIHKTAIISSNARIGRNVQILAGSIVGSFANIGNHTIINTGSQVDHDCTIGHNCHIAPGAILTGQITLEDNVFVGANATIIPRLHISSGAIIGAGAVVTKNVAARSTVVGNPARPLLK